MTSATAGVWGRIVKRVMSTREGSRLVERACLDHENGVYPSIWNDGHAAGFKRGERRALDFAKVTDVVSNEVIDARWQAYLLSATMPRQDVGVPFIGGPRNRMVCRVPLDGGKLPPVYRVAHLSPSLLLAYDWNPEDSTDFDDNVCTYNLKRIGAQPVRFTRGVYVANGVRDEDAKKVLMDMLAVAWVTAAPYGVDAETILSPWDIRISREAGDGTD